MNNIKSVLLSQNNQNNFGDFVIFGVTHNFVLITILTGSVLIFWYIRSCKYNPYSKISQSTKQNILSKNTSDNKNDKGNKDSTLTRVIGILIAIGLILQIIYFFGGHYFLGSFQSSMHLPFHLCSISAYLIILSIFSKNTWLSKLVLFWSPISALIAVVLPDMGKSENFPSFRSVEFFWSHILIVWGCVYILGAISCRIRYRDIWTSFGILIATLPIIKIINYILVANYMYLEKRTNGGQMDFLPSEPYHVVGILLIFLVVFHIEYFVYRTLQPKIN